MWMARYVRKTKMALFMAFALAGGTVFASCSMSDIRDNMIAGSLTAVKNATTNWIGSLLVDFTEFVEPLPGDYIITQQNDQI